MSADSQAAHHIHALSEAGTTAACLERYRGYRRKREIKEMKKKDERKADLGLKRLRITPRIYHFETHVEPFTAITVAEDILTWAGVRMELDTIIYQHLPLYQHEKATKCIEKLRKKGIWGVAICDQRETINRQRGRTIAKGRLWKHLKKQAEKWE